MKYSKSALCGAVRVSAAIALSVGSGVNAYSEEKGTLEEVIVTAQKHAEPLQEVPIAITAITGQELEMKGIATFSAVLQNSPNITIQPYFGTSDTFFIYMRGMGQANPAPVNSEGAVGIYEDGFVISRPNLMTFDLADLDRVEILRGPQGTLYGRNTTGGTINIISKAPTGELGLKQNLDVGNRNMYRSLTTINLPKWHDISAKVSLLKGSTDGWVKNIGSSNDFNLQRQEGGRLQLHWDGMANVAADYFLEGGRVDSTPPYMQSFINGGLTVYANGGSVLDGPPDPQPAGTQAYTYPTSHAPAERTWRPIDLPLSKSRFTSQGLTLTWNLSDALTIKSLTGYRELKQNNHTDYGDFWNFGAPGNLAGFSKLKQHQFSQEFQFIGKLLDDRLEYVGGLYYFSETGSSLSRQDTILYFGGPPFVIPGTTAITGQKSKSQAAYGQATWHPDADRKLGLTIGARYTKDDRRFSIFGTDTVPNSVIFPDTDKKFSRFTPSFTVDYKWTDDVNSYAKVATGYRSGGFYFSGFQPPGSDYSFNPETLTSYELGLKSYLFDRRVRFTQQSRI